MNDGLIHHEELLERTIKSGLETRAISKVPILEPIGFKQLPANSSNSTQPNRERNRLAKHLGGHRLGEIAQGTMLHGRDCRTHAWCSGNEDYRDIEVTLADLPQQSNAVESRHADVRDHRIELPLREPTDRGVAFLVGLH